MKFCTFAILHAVIRPPGLSQPVEQKNNTAPAAPAAPAGAGAAPAKTPPNKRVLVIVGVLALVALGAGGRMWYRSANFVDTENAHTRKHHPVCFTNHAGIAGNQHPAGANVLQRLGQPIEACSSICSWEQDVCTP